MKHCLRREGGCNMKEHNMKHYIITALILIYLFLPLVGTFLYSIATNWQTTVLPEGITFKWYIQLLGDGRFLTSLFRSFFVCILTVIICLVIMIPTIFIIDCYFPKLDKVLSILSMIPFAIPGVVSAVGLLKIYSNGPVPLTGTIWILIGAYFVLTLPYMYRGIKNSMMTLDAKCLLEAAELLNANKFQTFVYVILPNIMKGIIVSALLSFSILFGEFVLTNLLAGGNFETVQIYLYNMRNKSGHLSSTVVIIYFVFVLITTTAALKLNKINNEQHEIDE